jgi:hypothetical protein
MNRVPISVRDPDQNETIEYPLHLLPLFTHNPSLLAAP